MDGAIFPYAGSKWLATKYYPAPTGRIVELFAGSASYACRYPDREVVLVDRDPVIARLWRWLITASEDQVLSLPDIAVGQSVFDLNLDPEPRWLIGFCIHPGSTYPANRLSGWGNENPEKVWGPAKRARIAASLKQIRHWRVVEGNWFDAVDDSPATWFVDPPYQVSSVRASGTRRVNKYKYNDVDYVKLGATCRSLMGTVIACEADGADWLPFTPLADISWMGGKRKQELVWIGKREVSSVDAWME